MTNVYAQCLLDGKQRPSQYNACSDEGECTRFCTKVFERIGDGVIYAINGIKQRGIKRYTFYRLRADRPEWAK